MKELWTLFFTFARIGAFTFGGGYAMLPIIQKEIVEDKQWATEAEVIDYFAIGQCTPGIIAVNVSTFIGYKQKKIKGALFATLGMSFPSIVIISIIAVFFQQFQNNPLIQHAFAGIRIVVIALIIQTVIKLWRQSIHDITGIFLCLLAFVIVAFTNFSPIYAIVFAAITGLISARWKGDTIK